MSFGAIVFTNTGIGVDGELQLVLNQRFIRDLSEPDDQHAAYQTRDFVWTLSCVGTGARAFWLLRHRYGHDHVAMNCDAVGRFPPKYGWIPFEDVVPKEGLVLCTVAHPVADPPHVPEHPPDAVVSPSSPIVVPPPPKVVSKPLEAAPCVEPERHAWRDKAELFMFLVRQGRHADAMVASRNMRNISDLTPTPAMIKTARRCGITL